MPPIRALTGVFFGLFVSLFPSTAEAQPFETAGVRALGMGGAFVAVADDATAAWWNPAGLGAGPFFAVSVERQDLDDRSATGLLVGTPPLGFSYVRTRVRLKPDTSRDTQSLVTHQTGITLLHSVAWGVTVGATVKFVRGLAAIGADDVFGRASNTVDLDAGAHVVSGPWRVGLTVRNVREPTFEAAGGVAVPLARRARAGLAWVNDQWSGAVDLDLTSTREAEGPRRMLAAGTERRWGRRVAARGGVRINTDGERTPLGAFGASAAVWGSLWVDGQITGGSRKADRGWGLAARIAF
jgi:hypothetical protein